MQFGESEQGAQTFLPPDRLEDAVTLRERRASLGRQFAIDSSWSGTHACAFWPRKDLYSSYPALAGRSLLLLVRTHGAGTATGVSYPCLLPETRTQGSDRQGMGRKHRLHASFERNSLWAGIAMSVGTRPVAHIKFASDGPPAFGNSSMVRPFRVCHVPRFGLSGLRGGKEAGSHGSRRDGAVRREKSAKIKEKSRKSSWFWPLGVVTTSRGGRAVAGVSWLLAPPHELAGAWAGTFLPGLPELWREAIVR